MLLGHRGAPDRAPGVGHHFAGGAATSGSTQRCSTRWPMRLCAAMTASWASICLMPPWTGRYTRRPAAATEPAKALLTGADQAGSGRFCATGRASRSPRRPTPRTATTSCCSSPLSPPPARWCAMWRPCTLTAAMTAAPSRRPQPAWASTTSCAPRNANRVPQPPRPQSRWDCDGPSSAPTRGCRTSGSYDATPTASHDTDSPNSPSPFCSPPNSSTGETAGVPHDHLPAHVLTREEPLKSEEPPSFAVEHERACDESKPGSTDAVRLVGLARPPERPPDLRRL